MESPPENMSKMNNNFRELIDKLPKTSKQRERKLILSALIRAYNKRLTPLNRSDFASIIGENKRLIDRSVYQKLIRLFIVDSYFVVRCEGYENIEFFTSVDWSNTLMISSEKEKHPYVQGYLFNAFRGHMNPKTSKFLVKQLTYRKRVRILSSIYCALIESHDDYSYMEKLLALFDKTKDYAEVYSVFSSMQDLRLPLAHRALFAHKLQSILPSIDKKFGLAKDVRKILTVMRQSRAWNSSKRSLSYIQVLNG